MEILNLEDDVPVPLSSYSAAEAGKPRSVRALQLELAGGVLGSENMQRSARRDVIATLRVANLDRVREQAIKQTELNSHPLAPKWFGSSIGDETWKHMPHAADAPWYTSSSCGVTPRSRGVRRLPLALGAGTLEKFQGCVQHHHVDNLYAESEAAKMAFESRRGITRYRGGALEAMYGIDYPAVMLDTGRPLPDVQLEFADKLGKEWRASARAARAALAPRRSHSHEQTWNRLFRGEASTAVKSPRDAEPRETSDYDASTHEQ